MTIRVTPSTPLLNPTTEQRVFELIDFDDTKHTWVFGPQTINPEGDYYMNGVYHEPAGWTMPELIAMYNPTEVFTHLKDLEMDIGL